ncbi:MAG: class I SAM-dependent methyltransferase [Anaerolineae bacterium]
MAEEQLFDEMYEDPVIGRIDFAGKDVLEIGCGDGGFTLDYLTRASYILGLDPDAEAIERLRAQWPGPSQDSSVDFRVGGVPDFPLPERAFDIAVFSHSF